METNDTIDISPSRLWETAKVVIRGKIIAFATQKKERRNEKRTRACRWNKRLEMSLASKSTDKTAKDLIITKQELNKIINKRVKYSVLQLYDKSNMNLEIK